MLNFFVVKVKLKMLALFLSLKDNIEYICLEATLNRQTSYEMLFKWADLHKRSISRTIYLMLFFLKRDFDFKFILGLTERL